ncbi:protein-export membrane protein SecD [Desulfocucumis palustris]|uniref:Protein translocase subunit SecD n=1 Tax=Desulfocucumis palustris TaxID=1898651 RepID=A0A2L2XMZ7_9FIRM|nr:protein translocase subunit SecD [Desulfocucumis palustris]GBF35321.1 protein-export membrane protein SecD [Desulfocucumis palustris]
MKWSKVLILLLIIALVISAAVLSVAPVFDQNKTLGKYLPLVKGINLGLDLQGGVHVVFEAHDTPEAKVTPDTMKQLKAIIENRVNGLGVSEPIIQIQGERRLIVELAGIKDPEEAVRTIAKTAYLQFITEDGKTVVTGADLKDAKEGKNQNGENVINIAFTPAGTKKFAEATAANVNKRIAIVLDNQVLTNPNVNEPIPNGKAEITGYATLDEAHNDALLLRSGALPVKVTVEEKRSVGPALGADSLAKSEHAGLVGVVAILVFMLVYYRLPGLIADFALVIYTLIVLAVYVGLHVTMTLPGIAGFLLSLGIAVDANVIIFERLKEELRTGKSLRSAIDAGFKRGFTAVFDANVTTIIAAVVLYYLGTGPIKGFAVTLIIGILASMFTAISMTRWLLHLVAAANISKNPKYFGA